MAITPGDLMKAYQERTAQGLDPGFFLQPWNQSQQNTLLDNNINREVYQRKRLAALHAQEQYDIVFGGGSSLQPEGEENNYDEEDDERKRIEQENSDMMAEIFEMP
jgi:hypothetical protein